MPPAAGHGLRAYSAVIQTAVLGLVAWVALQFIDVRDSVRELKATVPIEIHDLDNRLTLVETRREQSDWKPLRTSSR